MFIESASTEYIYVPVTAPVADPTVLAVDMALVQQDTTPGNADWVTAAWRSPSPGTAAEVACLRDPLVWGDGEYMCFIRLHSIPETAVRRAGRVRIGDTRGQAA